MVDFPRRRGGFYHYQSRKYVTVTTVLRALAKPALVPWAAKEAAKAIFNDPYGITTEKQAVSAIYKTRDRAGDRGRAVHEYAQWIGEGKPKGPAPVHAPVGYRDAVDSFFASFNPQVLFTEANVYNDTHGYAGTADLIAEAAGRTWLIDYKTSKAVYPETGLQLAAYANAEFILHQDVDDPPKGWPAMTGHPQQLQLDMADIVSTAAVLLRPDGQFEWHPMQGDFEVFLSLKKVWKWSQQK